MPLAVDTCLGSLGTDIDPLAMEEVLSVTGTLRGPPCIEAALPRVEEAGRVVGGSSATRTRRGPNPCPIVCADALARMLGFAVSAVLLRTRRSTDLRTGAADGSSNLLLRGGAGDLLSTRELGLDISLGLETALGLGMAFTDSDFCDAWVAAFGRLTIRSPATGGGTEAALLCLGVSGDGLVSVGRAEISFVEDPDAGSSSNVEIRV